MGDIFSGLLGGAGLVLDQTSKHQAAVAQDHYQKQLHTNVTRAARQNYEMALAQLQYRSNQDKELASQEAIGSKVSFLKAQGSAKVNFAAHGIGGGNSVDALFTDFQRIENTNQVTIAKNLYWQQQELYQQMQQAKVGAEQQITMDLPQPITQPNYLATGVAALGSVLNGFDKFLSNTNPSYGMPNTGAAGGNGAALPPATPGSTPGDYAGEVNTGP